MSVSQSLTVTEKSYSTATNTSVVRILWTSEQTGQSHNDNKRTAYYYVSINGGTAAKYSVSYTLPQYETKTILDKEITVTHKDDGTGSVSVTTWMDTDISAGVVELSKSKTLTAIARKATLSSAPNFNQYDNPTITYSNPLGTNSVLTSLQACIGLEKDSNGSYHADIAYRDISKTGTSYTFEFTNAEKEKIKTVMANRATQTVRFYIRSVINGENFYSTLDKTLSIVKDSTTEPLLNPTVTDINSVTTNLTGSNAKFINGYSKAAVTFNASAQYGASLSGVKCVNGSHTLTTNGTINNVDSGTFTFTATDSRKFTTTKTITSTFVNYFKPTLTWDVDIPNAEGETVIAANGTWFNDTFGYRVNTIAIEYCYKSETDTNYTAWIACEVRTNGNTFTVEKPITVPDYTKAYTFKVRAVDKLEDIGNNEKTVKAIPVFTIGKEVVNFNVPVNVNNDITFENGEQTGERQIVFASNPSNQDENQHRCVLYGGNPHSGTGIGCWDFTGTNDRKIWNYSNVTNTLYLANADANVRIKEQTLADFVIETKVNQATGSWSYRKWNSGAVEMWGRFTVKPTQQGVIGGVAYSNPVQISMPFGVQNMVLSGTIGGAAQYISAYDWSYADKYVKIRFARPSAIDTGDNNVYLRIDGYWKAS